MGTDARRRPTCRGRAKSKGEPQELSEQRREREIFPCSLRSSRLNSHNQFDVPCICGNQNRQWIITKLRWWIFGATVDLGFATCDWLDSDFYVYFSIVFSTCYNWWICLLVWLLSSFLLITIFNFNNIYFILVTLFYLFIYFFFLFFLPFLLSHVSDRVLVLRPHVRPEPLRLESWVQEIGQPETSWSHVISITKRCPRDLCLNTQTHLHSMTSKLQCWTPYAK